MAGVPLSEMIDTWDDASTVFDAIRMNVTDTASNTNSKLINLLVGGAERFSVRKDGVVNISQGISVGNTKFNIGAGSSWVGIGTSSPKGNLHIWNGNSGAGSPPSTSRNLVVEAGGNAGISILSPASSVSQIAFGAPGDATGVYLNWSHNNNLFRLGTSKANADISFRAGDNSEVIRLDGANNRVGINEAEPDYQLHVNGTFGVNLPVGGAFAAFNSGDVIFEIPNNTAFRIKVRGTDGVTRQVTLGLS